MDYDELINIDVCNSNNKILTLDGLVFLSHTNNSITQNGKYYIDFMKSNTNLEKYYNHLLKHFNKALSRKLNESKKVNENKEPINSQQQVNYLGLSSQNGGGAGLVFGILGGIGLSAVVAYFIYKWITRPICKLTYPILTPDEIPDKLELLSKIVPESWIEGKNVEIVKEKIINRLQTILSYFSFLDTDGSTLKSIGVNLARVTTSVALDVATFGAGGDVIISLLFTIKSILDLMMSIIGGIIGILDDEEGTRFIYDVFNIDFTDGPFGVKCWVGYMLNQYGGNTKVYSVVCKFFDKLLNKVAKFIGNAFGTMIPNSAGLPAILIPLLVGFFREGALNMVEKEMNKYFEKIPHDMKIMIKDPELLIKYLQHIISSAKPFLLGKGKGLFKTLNNNTEIFAFGLHKFFALSFALLQLFKMCGNTQVVTDKHYSVSSPKKRNVANIHKFRGTRTDKIREFKERYKKLK